MDAKTRQIMAFHLGDRSRESAKQWWAKIPLVTVNRQRFIRTNMKLTRV
jgi:hypothetical protein